MAWTEERIERLREMWEEGFTAGEIAHELGGVSRNAVIGKAHRSGLQSRPSMDDGDWSVCDPILEIEGASTMVSALLDWRWPSGGKRYVDRDITRVLDLAKKIAIQRTEDPPAVSATDLVEATIGTALGANQSETLQRIATYLVKAEIFVPQHVTAAHDAQPGRAVDMLLRWDAVEVMAECARIRDRTMKGTGPSHYGHLIAALVSSPIAVDALRKALLPKQSLEVFRSAALEIIGDKASRRGDGENWEAEILRIGRTPIASRRRRAGYASDRVVAGGDVFGTAADARALADLVTLQAAEPPLAIAIFGAWGSGKSTLIAELKRAIVEQVELEKRLNALSNDPGDGLARVTGVMQLDFNAWTFADSDNLWASLTAELFDQIAAGGSDPAGAAIGARLVAEVAARTGREAGELTLAKMQLEQSDEAIATAKKALRIAEDQAKGATFSAMFDGLSEMLGAGDEKDDDEADDNEPADDEDDDSEQDGKTGARSSAVKALREALLIDQGETGAQLVRGYAESGSSMVRFAVFARAWLGSTKGRRAVGIAAAVGMVFGIAWWFREDALASVRPLVRWFTSSALLIMPVAFAVWTVALPVIRGAGLMRDKFLKTLKQNEEVLAAARKRLVEGQKNRNEAQATIERTASISAKLGSGIDPRSLPPERMLDYLLKDSADLVTLRGRLGTLGTVRRCFEQLNSILERMRKADPDTPVQRIIIYIDDLDRCSESQVIKILEAIHLLLAFPCFVVVTAVDARWLRASLTTEHGPLSRASSGIDPADYLEKIFQIPFWVRPMNGNDPGGRADYSSYLKALLRVGREDPRPEAESDGLDTEHGPQGDFPRLHPERPSISEQETDRNRQMMISSREVQLLEAMQPIAARSPRAVKRMINIYRLIRVSVPEHLVEDYLGAGRHVPPYWATILILACEIGLPSSGMVDLAFGLSRLGEEDTYPLDALARGDHDQAPGSVPMFVSPELSSLLATPAGQALLLGMRAVSAAGIRLAPGPLVTALETVRRYSFRPN